MKYGLMKWLACPACGSSGLRLSARTTRSAPVWAGQVREDTPGYDAATGQLEEVVEGAITCGDCARVYAITDGIPHLLVEDAPVPRSAHVTSHFDVKAPEWEQEFRDFVDPLGPDDFLGQLTLDVGCGFGRGAFFAARWGAEVIAMDVDLDILVACRDNTRDLPRVHHVHADARHLPFAPRTFDIVYALGVLHHLEQPWDVFHEIGERVAAGGRLSIWAYGPRQGASAAVSALLRGVAKDMPPEELLNVSRVLATLIRGASHTPYRFFRRVPGMRSLVSHLPMHDHHRWPYDIVVADIYDRLRIPVTQTFTSEELESRYVDEGFLDVQTSRRVRNNESFRATGIRR